MRNFLLAFVHCLFFSQLLSQESYTLSPQGSSSETPAVSVFPDGRFAVVWKQDTGLVLRLLSPDGLPESGTFVIRANNSARNPDVVVGSDNNIRIVWKEGSNTFFSIVSEQAEVLFVSFVPSQASFAPRISLGPNNLSHIVVERQEFVQTRLSLLSYSADGSVFTNTRLTSRITNENRIEPDIVTDHAGVSAIVCHLSVQTSFYDFFLILVDQDSSISPRRLFSVNIRDSNPLIAINPDNPETIFLYQISVNDGQSTLCGLSPGPESRIIPSSTGVRSARAAVGSDGVCRIIWNTNDGRTFLATQMPALTNWVISTPRLLSDSANGSPDIAVNQNGVQAIFSVDGQITAQHFPESSFQLPHFIRGDSNGDTFVDISDCIHILLGLFESVPLPCMSASDANANHSLELSDAVFILNHVFGGGPSPDGPFPNCGSSSNSVLGCGQKSCP